jgi:hypothetical protein
MSTNHQARNLEEDTYLAWEEKIRRDVVELRIPVPEISSFRGSGAQPPPDV